MAQSVKHPTLDFGSGHDLMVLGIPCMGLNADSEDPAWDSLSLTLSKQTLKKKKLAHETLLLGIFNAPGRKLQILPTSLSPSVGP